MTRRTFLRVLGSGIAATAVVQAVPEALVAPASPAWPTYEAVSRPLTYKMIEAAYKSCVIGSERPTFGICSSTTARYLGLVFDVEFEEAA